ncbi:MAG: outer membrane protein transport protein [Myxococcales bacterium]|nr:outer membrane protein transport protein [Myxococcales bacterium]
MRIVLASLIALLPTSAGAGGFLVSKIGGDSAGPAAATPAAIFWNPGALGLLDGTHLYFDANLFYRDARYVRASGGRYGGQAHQSGVDAQPTLAAVSDLGLRDWTFGVGVYAPFGSGSVWDDPHGPQRYHGIYGGIRGIYVTPTAVWTPIAGLHLGLGLSYVRASVTSYRALDLGAEIAGRTGGDVPLEQPGNEGRALLDFAGNAFAWTAGLAWQRDDWTLGVSYSSSVDIDLPGTLSIYVPRNDFFMGLTGGDVSTPATFAATWPSALRLGAMWQVAPRWTLSASSEIVSWSQYDDVRIDAKREVPGLGDVDQVKMMGYADTFGLRLGVRWQWRPTLAFFGGLGGETSAVPESHLDPSLFDAPKGGAALGFSWALAEHVTWTSSYNHLAYLPVTVRHSEMSPDPAGVHSQQVGILNANVNVHF